MGILRDRMIEEMTLRNFAPTTQKSYLYAVTRLAKYYKRPPDQVDKEEIRSYLLYLIAERKLSPKTMTAMIAGLCFFYNETLGWDETKLFIPPRKKTSHLPEVLSPNEVVRLIDAAKRYKKVAHAEALIWKILMIAEKKFRRLNAPRLLEDVY